MSKKITARTWGGGLLTAAGIGIPAIAEIANLQMPTWLGLLGIFLCIVAVPVGLALIFLPQSEKIIDPPDQLNADTTTNVTSHNQRGGVTAHTINQRDPK